jgi:cytochrome o ubiquinol oxidase operon protein cyoD
MSHPHEHDNHAHHEDDGYHATAGGYAVGFGLSVLLTAIPFWLVMDNVIASPTLMAFVVLAFAVVQIVVHMIFFLHMNAKSEGGWTLLALIFTLVLVVITLAGSLWVMHHLNQNMMPMPHPVHGAADVHDMSDMP